MSGHTVSQITYDVFYKLATGESNPLAGVGKAEDEKVTESKVSPEELRMGVKIEREHTDNPDAAKEIALDHLTEVSDYYTRLNEMEDEAKEEQEGPSKKEPTKEDIRRYLKGLCCSPDDEEFHEHSSKMNYNNHKAEAEAYALAKDTADKTATIRRSTMYTPEQIAAYVLYKVAAMAQPSVQAVVGQAPRMGGMHPGNVIANNAVPDASTQNALSTGLGSISASRPGNNPTQGVPARVPSPRPAPPAPALGGYGSSRVKTNAWKLSANDPSTMNALSTQQGSVGASAPKQTNAKPVAVGSLRSLGQAPESKDLPGHTPQGFGGVKRTPGTNRYSVQDSGR